jgi:nitrogen fixation protein FixH
MKIALALLSAVVLAVIGITIYVGGQVAEPTVITDPYEHGLRYDHDRALRARLGFRAVVDPAGLRPGGEALGFTLVDRDGRPVEGAMVQVAVTRPAGGGGDRRGEARALGDGRYLAPVGFAGPGFWDVRLDVKRGGDVVGLVQQVRVEAASAGPCDLAAAPCATEAGGLAIALDLGRALVTMKDLPIGVEVRRAGAPVEGAVVEVAFAMKDMNMGENRVALLAAGPGRYAGKGVLVRCGSGRKDWIASVTVRVPGLAPASVQVPFAVRE